MTSNEMRLQQRQQQANATIAKLQQHIGDILPQFPVEFAYLHGSIAQGYPLPDSDVDIAIMLSDSVATGKNWSTLNNIAYAIGCACGWDFEKVDVRAVNDAPLAVRGTIVQTGLLLYERDSAMRVDFEVLTRSMYFDYAPAAAKMRRAFLQRIRERGLAGD